MDHGASSYRRFLDGDKDAVSEIMEELFFPLVFFINRYVQDVYAAEDIAMDTVTQLFVHPKRYHFQVSLKTYLFMLGKSRAISYLRHRKRLRETELTEAESTVSAPEELEAKVLADERSRAVNAALEQLSPDMRMAVHLVYFASFSYEETAKIMKKDKKQVDNLLYRAKKELRTILGEEGRNLL